MTFWKKLKTNSIPNKNFNSIVAWDEFISDVFIGKCHDQWELKGQIFLGEKKCFKNWRSTSSLFIAIENKTHEMSKFSITFKKRISFTSALITIAFLWHHAIFSSSLSLFLYFSISSIIFYIAIAKRVKEKESIAYLYVF